MSSNAMMRFAKAGFPVLLMAMLSGTVVPARTATAERCGADQKKPAERIFANADGKSGWREYRSATEIPELQLDAGQAAWLWSGREGNILIQVQDPGEDFAAYADYCFDASGELVHLRYELRTAWGWGYREEGPVVNGKFAREVSEFFDTKSEASVKRPEQADDVAEALKPHVYLRKSQLPFAKLLPKRT